MLSFFTQGFTKMKTLQWRRLWSR